MAVELPQYPVAAGKRIANQLGARRDRYQAAARRLRQELAGAEEAWTRAFEQEDARTAAQDRIDRLAARDKRIL